MDNSTSHQSGQADPTLGDEANEYKNRVEQLEREKHGMYQEMKSEREKRQLLESRLEALEQGRKTAADKEVDAKVEDFVNTYVVPRVAKRFEADIKTTKEKAETLERALSYNQAIEWLAEQEGSTPSKVRGSKLEREIDDVAKRYNLAGMDIYNGAKTAYTILQKERKAKEEAEQVRDQAINQNATQTVTTSKPMDGKRRWTESEILRMDVHEYQRHIDDINAARNEGRLVLDVSKKNERGGLEWQSTTPNH